ncbi:MAG: PTS glucose transporter subunit IIA [Lactococcus chungangensis]|uniref:PTS glucose transporter subunit IIA n=1 Tax=Pseudolactococcus chungangensis TaxID=451457 RepID=A0A847J4M2_9LACT|nr:PTS glucose transporter subunit IIA [Lacticaseibacillus paracasei]MDS0814294.1 PTS glucose transporter subunit IIA [Lacticaseibacillus paracasei]NLH35511.1 PTS glucose transporter subunit IIA [Lactococcus chungangensis]
MFKFFKKNPIWAPNSILAPSDGTAVPINTIEDPVFSQGAMGIGVAVNPSSDNVYAPVSGNVTMVAATKHGIGISTAEGRDILIHMGVDTVELKGKPFKVLVNSGDEVKAGEKIAVINRQEVEANGKLSTIIVVETNSAERKDKLNLVKTGTVKHGTDLAKFSY